MHIDNAREAKDELRRFVSSRVEARQAAPSPAETVAVGICVSGEGSYGVAVRFSADSDLGQEVATRGRELVGSRCDVREVGLITALQWSPEELQARARPLRPGVSVAHIDVTAGTLGGFVVPRRGGAGVHVLSNNHVLADSDRAERGEAVLQPGPADGGTEELDRIGVLDRVVPLRAGGGNVVDAATALLDDGIDVDTTYPAGALAGVAEALSGILVEKAGRTTGVTRGRVSAIEVDDVTVQYPVGSVSFDGQIEVTGDGGSFSAGGDSGSLVYRQESLEAVGLLFAGSERGGVDGTGLTYCNPIVAVLDELDVDLVT